MKYLKKFESYVETNIQNLFEGVITDKNKELISYDLRLKQETEKYLEDLISQIRPQIEECLAVLIDDYDLTPDYFMNYGSEKMVDNAIFVRNHSIKGGSLIISHLKYKIENNEDSGLIDSTFQKELLTAFKKLNDIGLELHVTSFKIMDEESNEESSSDYKKDDLLGTFTNLLATGKFMLKELRFLVKDKSVE